MSDTTFTLFLWEQATPSVRAGRRFPAERVNPLEYRCTATAPLPRIDGVDLEVTRRGRRTPLWTAASFRSINEGDVIRFTLKDEWAA